MRFFSKSPDGGKDSGVTGYFLVEIKSMFSIVLLHFAEGSREAYHEHAFNAWTLWLWGAVVEWYQDGSEPRVFIEGDWKYTPRECFHKIEAVDPTWALSFRGPWVDTWREDRKGEMVTLTHGRKEVPPCAPQP